MPRYRLGVEYDGGPYKGFQRQAEGTPSVQGALEAAITGFSGETARVFTAGRTDTGVHASGQVVHVDLVRDWPAPVVRDALNAHLIAERVAVLSAVAVGEDFHARFSARGRRYLYRILDRRPQPTLERGRVWWVRAPLDAQAMDEAARGLLGRHDFTTFRDVRCQANSPLRTLDEAVAERVGAEVHVRFAARSFLHKQVRSMVGTLAEVGAGRWAAGEVAAALAARDRSACGPVAPPEGLCLTGVVYGEASADRSVI